MVMMENNGDGKNRENNMDNLIRMRVMGWKIREDIRRDTTE